MEKTDRSYVRKLRYLVQWSVFLMVMYAGVSFYFFVSALEHGALPSATRSPSIEGFMPIGALMSLKLWLAEGVFDPVHPAALALFTGSLALALLLKKSFCGWICPVGTLSDAAWKTGRKAFGREFTIPAYIDYPLRSLKYILMAFFLYIILIKMSAPQISVFLNTPYWKVADVKLLKFFTEMSLTTGITLSALLGLSLLYKNFWCRYLCPYGGLLGLLSALSPVKVKRNGEKCIRCGLCAKHCPSLLPVDRKIRIKSPECTGCLSCVSHCPAKGALDISVAGKKSVPPVIFAAAVAGIFFILIFAAMAGGKWHSSVTPGELRNLVPSLKYLEHP